LKVVAGANKAIDLFDLLAGHVFDADTAWSVGTFGAIAEFMRDADEGVVMRRESGTI
jgi:hypothetical protein